MCDTADDGVGISNSVPNEERLERSGYGRPIFLN